MSSRTHLHCIFVHGFRGDHTSFQRFPSDIDKSLRSKLPDRFEVSSYLYPTYPSVRPIAFAVQQFLAWLAKQPPGPVVLFAHSMGGLLAAEAATSPDDAAKRIVMLVGLDVPFLGLHPHVVITGIASLMKKDDPDVPKEKELNNHKIHIVPEHDAFASPVDETASKPSTSTTAATSSTSVLATLTGVVDKYNNHPVVQFLNRHADDPLGGVHRWIVKNLEFGSSMYDASGLLHRYDTLVHWNGRWVNYWTTTIPIPGVDPSDAPELLEALGAPAVLTPGLGKDSSRPVLSLPFGLLSKPDSEAKWWQSALPAEHEIYDKLTTYFSSKKRRKDETPSSLSPNVAPTNPSSSSSSINSTSSSGAEHAPHHFIVLPYNSGNRRAKWPRITVAGAADEVEAHQGIFMKDKNLDYDAFVDRVARLVALWSRDL